MGERAPWEGDAPAHPTPPSISPPSIWLGGRAKEPNAETSNHYLRLADVLYYSLYYADVWDFARQASLKGA